MPQNMPVIKIAVCDDELSAVQNLSEQIQRFMAGKGLQYTLSKFFSGESLLSATSDRHTYFDAVFLDIKMKTMNGIDTAKEIRKTNAQNQIIFVTVLKDYVFDAFEVNAANYLLKPIDSQKLDRTLEKIAASVFSTAGQFLTLQKNGQIKKIPLSGITYCEVINHRVFIYERKDQHECGLKIDDLEKELPADFFRCHRSYIVNLNCVQRYAGGFAYLSGGEKIPIATRRQQDFMQALLHIQRKEVH